MKQRNLAWTYGPRPRIVQLNLRQKFLKWLKATRDNQLCKLCALWHLWHKIILDLCAYSVESKIYTTICFANLQGGSTECISKHCNLCYIKYEDFKTPQMYRAVCFLCVFSLCFLCMFCDSFTSIYIFVYAFICSYIFHYVSYHLNIWHLGVPRRERRARRRRRRGRLPSRSPPPLRRSEKTTEIAEINLTTCVCMVYNLCFFQLGLLQVFICLALCFKTFMNKKTSKTSST